MSKRALIAWGGWEGHTPEACAAHVAGVLTAEGYDVATVEGSSLEPWSGETMVEFSCTLGTGRCSWIGPDVATGDEIEDGTGTGRRIVGTIGAAAPGARVNPGRIAQGGRVRRKAEWRHQRWISTSKQA